RAGHQVAASPDGGDHGGAVSASRERDEGVAHGLLKLPGFRRPRVRAMKRQNTSISATRSTARRTASASVATPRAFLARRSARVSTKNDLRSSPATVGM